MVDTAEQKPFHKYILDAISEVSSRDSISMVELSDIEITMVILGKMIIGTLIPEGQREDVHRLFKEKAEAIPFLVNGSENVRELIQKMDGLNNEIGEKTRV